MQTPNAPPDAAVARFRDDLHRLAGEHSANRFGIAVSGGPDSIALLLLAHAALPHRIEAATVDHRLRPESTSEAALVGQICATLNVPHTILTLGTLLPGNVSAAARDARYVALHAWADNRKIDWLLTAHHADDQRETVLMRLNRASGVGGLAGIRARQGRVLRPLLSWRRAMLATIITEAGLIAVDDPANRDDRYDRARMRKQLANADWLDAEAITRSAAALAEVDSALDWLIADLRTTRLMAAPDGSWTYDAQGLPAEVQRRALIDCLQLIDPAAQPRGDATERLRATLTQGGGATLSGVRCDVTAGRWRFHPAPPRRTK